MPVWVIHAETRSFAAFLLPVLPIYLPTIFPQNGRMKEIIEIK